MSATPSKVSRSHCPPTAIPPSSAGSTTTRVPERHGCSRTAAAPGPQQGTQAGRTGGEVPTQQGFSVALSADGNTAIVGGLRDAWVFTRNGGTWTQQGAKLAGTGAVGNVLAFEGRSVALSADGNTALVGADASNFGGRRNMGVHAQRRHLDPAGREACRQRRVRG